MPWLLKMSSDVEHNDYTRMLKMVCAMLMLMVDFIMTSLWFSLGRGLMELEATIHQN